MGGLSNYLLEKVQSKTGLSTAVIIGYALQGLFGIGATILFFAALFFVFSDYLGFGATTTSIGMFLAFVLLLVSAMLWTSGAKKKTIADAERALQAHGFVSMNAPLLNVGVQLGQKLGGGEHSQRCWRCLRLRRCRRVSRRRHHPHDPMF
jgi:hypothetical protein